MNVLKNQFKFDVNFVMMTYILWTRMKKTSPLNLFNEIKDGDGGTNN